MHIPERIPLDWGAVKQQLEVLAYQDLVLENLNTWLRDWSNIECKVRQEEAFLRWAAYKDVTDTIASEATKHHQERLLDITSAQQALANKFVQFYKFNPDPKYKTLVQHLQSELILGDLSDPAVARSRHLSETYYSITNATRVLWKGEQVRVGKVSSNYNSTDPTMREAAWRAVQKAKTEQAQPKLEALYLELVRLRQEIAHKNGFSSYVGYSWQVLKRFDYAPQDCHEFYNQVIQSFSPLRELTRNVQRNLLGVKSLRPWDLTIDPTGRPHLKSFTSEDLFAAGKQIVRAMDPTLGEIFSQLPENDYLDLEFSPSKSGQSYTDYFVDSNKSLIFVKPSQQRGIPSLNTLIHEFGHACCNHFGSPGHLYWEKLPSMEFQETVCHTFELIALDHLDGAGFSPEDIDQARWTHVNRIVNTLLFGVTLDQLQHWVYAQDTQQLTADSIGIEYERLSNAVYLGVDWMGFEHHIRSDWQVNHPFLFAFYYVEYALAWIGALILLKRYRSDSSGVIDNLKEALKHGGSLTTKSLLEHLGLEFPFSKQSIEEAAGVLETEIRSMLYFDKLNMEVSK
jgi:oligoendopeptidase F